MAAVILIIDDNEQDRKIMTRFLNKAGYDKIITAENGSQGAQKAESEKPDLVIIDTMLPDTDGFEVCRRIRERCGPAKPKIIVTTGSIDAIDAVRAKRLGADDYCVKSGDSALLIEAVKELVS